MRRRDAEASRDAILQATIQLLGSLGLHAVTTQGIAKSASCAKGLVNYHFPTRADLWRAVIREGGEAILGPRSAAMSGSGVDVVDASWGVLQAEAGDRTGLMWSGIESLGADDGVGTAVRDTKRVMASRWERAVNAWLGRSGFARSASVDVANASWALLNGFAMALIEDDPDALFPAYVTAWLGLIAGLERAVT